jgi:hypothetical protein
MEQPEHDKAYSEKFIALFAVWLTNKNDTRQFIAIFSQKLREAYGVNIPDVMELEYKLFEQIKLFRNGKLPLNDAEDITTESTVKYSELVTRLGKDIEKYKKLRGELLEKLNERCTDEEIQEEPVMGFLKTLYNYLLVYMYFLFEFQKLVQDAIYNDDSNYRKIRKKAYGTPLKSETADTETEDGLYFMQIMKNEYPKAFTAIKKGMAEGIIEFKNKLLNFKCDKGCVGLVFNESGFTQYKQIVRFITINGETPKKDTLKNCKKNTPPAEWKSLKHIFFPTTPK